MQPIDRELVLSIARRIEVSFPPGLTDLSRGYTSFMGGVRLYNKLRELDTEAELRHVVDSMNRLGHIPHLDRSLVLAIAFRESAQLVLSRSADRVDSFRRGGLDGLGRVAGRLVREGILPPDTARELRPGYTGATEGDGPATPRHAAAALVPKRELLVAYGAVITDRYNRFQRAAGRLGLTNSALAPRERRVWTAVFFGGPNGLDYSDFHRLSPQHSRDEGWMSRNFGANTILTFLVGNRLGLKDIVQLHRHELDLYRATRTMSAFIVTAEAEVLDALAIA